MKKTHRWSRTTELMGRPPLFFSGAVMTFQVITEASQTRNTSLRSSVGPWGGSAMSHELLAAPLH
ncbi:hypothetical protein, partial [Pseudomonas sp. SIMBA_044]|uniref:hypothetical protein n=1 Tax=Pseudomonas sp. SIMBA_044 TaxID=3085785 RepID=UPI0039797C7D